MLAVCGCEVEWGGARLALVDPSPPEPAEAGAADTVRPPPPLPEGPLLYAVRGGTETVVVPVARLAGGRPAPLGLPAGIDAAYRTRFDSAFLRPGSELALLAGGARVGSLALGDERRQGEPGCPGVAVAHPLLPPGGALPAAAVAVPLEAYALTPSSWTPRPPTGRMAAYAPILAERILREAGADQPWLARAVALAAVPVAGAEGMAATYLLGDTLAPVPPPGEAVSLFFLARPEPVDFEPRWTVLRRYASAEEKEAYAWLDRVPLPGGEVDFLLRYDAASVRLAASPVEEERRITWVEESGCAGLTLPAESLPR